MDKSTYSRWSPVALVAGISLVTLAFAANAQTNSGPDTSARQPVVLAKPPAAGSEDYRILKRVAGDMQSETLDMTGGQVWLVEPDRIDMLLHVADEKNAGAERISDDASRLLRKRSDQDPLTPSQNAMIRLGKADKAVTGMMLVETAPPHIMEFALAKYKARLAKGDKSEPYGPPEIVIPVSDARQITIRRTYFDTTREGCVWFGTIVGTNEQVSLMWWPDGRMTGSFTHAGRIYTIKNIAGRVHAVIESDPARMPADHASATSKVRDAVNSGRDPLVLQGDASMLRSTVGRPKGRDVEHLKDAAGPARSVDTKLPGIVLPTHSSGQAATQKIRVDLLVGYTKKSAQHYSDIHRELIALAVEQTNQTFRNSGIDNLKVSLAGSFATDYDESSAHHLDHLWRMADRGDGHMEEVHKLRDEKRADIVVLIVDDPSGCGLSTRVGADAHEAFAVVHHGCATSTYSLAHEIGHIFGARHDRTLDTSTEPFPWGHGYVNAEKWRTMMAYRSSCNGCPRMPVWSNGVARIGGEPAGSDDADNARVLREQASRVANFR